MSNALTLGFTISNGTISKHSLTDYGLAVANTNYLGDPTMETYTVDVPGRAGILDLSTALTGYPVFKNREIAIEVGALKATNNWDSFISDLRNNFEGQQCTITFDNDTTWYWQGRVHITDFDRTRRLGTFTIEMDADAYKYKTSLTEDSYSLSSTSQTITKRTYSAPVPPYFYCSSGNATVTFSSVSYALTSGNGIYIPGLTSKSTGNITATGSGTLKVRWREMSL